MKIIYKAIFYKNIKISKIEKRELLKETNNFYETRDIKFNYKRKELKSNFDVFGRYEYFLDLNEAKKWLLYELNTVKNAVDEKIKEIENIQEQ